ncbi:MAG: uroporphyrinogen-III synthase [Deltaproteobacteria bacterium]|nr:MAG: uroporphyrinogen-III synthase [Deltaproteobacteria bacterium]
MSAEPARRADEDEGPRPDRVHRVLVTRSESDAGSLIDALEALGLEAPHLPLIVRELATESTAQLRRALVTAEIVLLTSATSARAVGRVWREPVRAPRFACVGPATAEAAREAGLPVDVVPDSATGVDLVRALGSLEGARVLYPRPEMVASGTREALERAGADLTEIVAYRNVPPADAHERLREIGNVDLVTLFSGSAARRYQRACRRAGLTPARAIAIGPSTAATARSVGLDVVRVANPHTENGVIEAVRSTLLL